MPLELPSGTGELTVDDITDLLGEGEGELEFTPPDKEKEKTGEEDKEKEKEKGEGEKEKEEVSIELKEETETEKDIDEELKLITPFKRKEILAKYPDVFKDFPYLEKAYFRDQQFTEIFPTIEDAKETVEKAETLDKFEGRIMSGEIGDVLTAVRDQDNKAFNKIVDNYLPALAKVSPEAYYHVLGNVIKNTIMSMVQESKRSNNEGLQVAAQLLNQFIFGTSEFTRPTKLAGEQDNTDERSEVEQERARFTRERFETVRDDLNTKIHNVLKSTIDGHIDPRKSMTDYVRKNAVRDAMDILERVMRQDPRFNTFLDSLWKKAFESKFDRVSTDKIKAAYLSRAKTLLPSVIKKARIDALSGQGKSKRDDNDEESDRRGPVPAGRTPSTQTREKKGEIPKGMRTLDFFMQE